MPPPWTTHRLDPDSPTWEYQVETRPLTTSDLPGSAAEAQDLAAWGQQGWELVTVMRVSLEQPHQSGLAYYWKRKGV